ncbi:unnamed protein product [Miscanthus lutarioriparius]|uniref:DUF4378 domain-containing protein n=1 Tax=Miscanthus lutarioriparius TaxID=422564 RepID=A0A811RZ44_9POAL|nr:unnamed protein product [Miscanthus lutarioriparius]
MRRPVVHLQPNVIARLMGIDDAAVQTSPPAPRKPVAGGVVQFQAQRQPYYAYRGGNDDAEYSGSSSRICLHKMMIVPRSRSRSSRLRRPRRHPQEDLLQKMRQDLQAWQASKEPALQLQTSGARPSDSDGGGRSLVLQAIAQEDLRKQKMARYGLGLGLAHSSVTQQEDLSLIKNKKMNGGVAQGEGDPSSEHAAAAAETPAMPDDRDLDARRDGHGHGHCHGEPAAQAQELPSHRHTPIVLLKPATCSESDTTGGVAIGGGQKTSVLLGLPKLHRDANMSMLLQEVKDRVQRELTVLTAATTTATGGEAIKAPTWAIPPLQQVTKEDRENKRRLFRSESFRAFRSDRKRNAATAHASPEAYILTKSQTVSPAHEESVTTSDASLSVLRPGVGGVTDGQSFRSEYLTLTKHKDEDAVPSPPRLLFRSFSAPESGFSSSSLGSRLFGDAIGSSARSTKHGASEPPSAAAAVTLTTKNVVSASLSSFIRGTVSSLRHSFSSRRNLPFRRKTHWSNKASLAEIHPAKMEMPVTSPSHETFSLFKANLSEVPPSPVSPLKVAAGHSSRHFFTDLHFTLPPELSPKCLSEFEAPATASESSFRTDITAVEAACSRDKAYITEVLIASGLYDDDDGPSSANARVDSMARPMPICDDVFEDVEDMYYYRGDCIVGGGMYDDHRMLFDLANEALQSLVVESSKAGSSSLRQWVVDSTGVAPGKKLVDDVWQKVQALRNHPQTQEMQTIDGMVAYEVRRSVWTEVLHEDVYVVGRKIERAIFDELIEDFLHALEVFI